MAAHASATTGHEELNYLNWKTGIWSWLSSTDHKRICFLYLFAISIFFLAGGTAALLMRTELATAGPTIIKDPHTYNVLFTMHGVFMIFLFRGARYSRNPRKLPYPSYDRGQGRSVSAPESV